MILHAIGDCNELPIEDTMEMLIAICHLQILDYGTALNPCGAAFMLGNIKSYLYFLSFLQSEMAQVVEIFRGRQQGSGYLRYSIP